MAALFIGELLEAQGRPLKANVAYGAIATESPLSYPARLRMARNLDARDQTEEAIATLKRLGKRHSDEPEALVTLGHILRGHERFAEAASAYDEAIVRIGELQPEHWRLLYSRGISLERSKQWERAEADFLRALGIGGEQAYVLNYLGYSWVDRGINLERAEEMIVKAVKLRPNDGFIADSLGWVYYRSGRYEEAVTALERAVALEPADPIINEHLGDAYWRVGRILEARFQWQRALKFQPETPRIADLKAKLECSAASCLPVQGGT
jgi:Flp pilus assembly protein TadD